MKIIFPLAFGTALFLSPDFLTVFGNGIGRGGVWFLCFLALVFVFHCFTAESYGAITILNRKLNNEYDLITGALGGFTGFVFPLIIKALLPVCMGVGLLASAGYAFNELFARWFPNMAFTLLSLGILLFAGFAGRRAVNICQLIFSGVSFAGIISLTVMGLLSFPETLLVSMNFYSVQFEAISIVLICFVLLMGFEMAAAFEERKSRSWFSLKNLMITALLCGFIALSMWGVVSLMHVSPERLSDTYIPHLITARAINSIYGRQIMGFVIIFSSLGAVNALLTYVSSMHGDVLSKIPAYKMGKQRYKQFSFVSLTLAIAVLLIFGMAGKPGFETFIRGSIYLWLLNYAFIHLAIFLSDRKAARNDNLSLKFRNYGNLISSVLICGIYYGLILTDSESVLIFKNTVIITGGALLIYLFYRFFISKLIYKSR